MKSFYCTECGIELDEHDVDANIATWGDFKCVCTECVEIVDTLLNPPKRVATVYNGHIIYGS